MEENASIPLGPASQWSDAMSGVKSGKGADSGEGLWLGLMDEAGRGSSERLLNPRLLQYRMEEADVPDWTN
ncbi:Hypothetical protein GbCGDNIH3_7098 [Granulibacter bethesdensis]|uniref:Uncharacterized protein n=1 Tax=Granulibacter bethesdensis TaxID=364410 RepID=A0AAN0RDX7_9PROT|nr:hypothetical protein [Granulibacter bethesdensis]AHJ63176.1 Hypothetical protein GbCGDNIH3_7098 [Granulibacter bethesdensis]